MMAEVFGPPLPPRTLRAHRVRQGRLNARQFNKALADWSVKQIPEDIQKVTQWLAFEALKRIVRRTPVDIGEARGGWHVTLTSPSNAPTATKDTKGGATISAGYAKIKLARPWQVIWISNNVKHIRILEEGGFVPANPGPSKTGGSRSKAGRKARRGKTLVTGGYSTQAPQGMVAITMRELLASGVIK